MPFDGLIKSRSVPFYSAG